MPGTVNEELADALVRHQIHLLRVSGSIRNQVLQLLNDNELKLKELLNRKLPGLAGRGLSPGNTKRLKALLAQIQELRKAAFIQVDADWLSQFKELARTEAAFASGALKTVSLVALDDLLLPEPQLLDALVRTHPFQGATLKQWSAKLAKDELGRFETELQMGLMRGEPVQVMARRLVGTANLAGADGVTEITRRGAASITRTAVNAYTDAARDMVYKANADIITEEQFVATLDSRTTPVCASLDGKVYAVGQGPRPPLHWQCRSLRVPVIDGDLGGKRPMKQSTERELVAEYKAARGVDAKGTTRKSLPRGTKADFDKFSRKRVRELTGQTPASTTYGQFLGRQSVAFQNEVLGVTKAKLFRNGGMTLDKFVDAKGKTLPLSALARKDAAAFRAAGLDPEDFL